MSAPTWGASILIDSFAHRSGSLPFHVHKEFRMARRSAPPPTPKSPILTVGQKRRRVERLQRCVTSLEVFDPQKARKRARMVLALEAAIDKALSSAFGYGTPTYLRYNQAAILDPSHFWPMPPFGAPSYLRLADQQETLRRLKKRANIFQRTRSGRLPCSEKRSAHLKKKLPMRSLWKWQCRNQRPRRS